MSNRSERQYAFDKAAYDHIHLQVPHGWKQCIKARAAETGKSVNEYIAALIRADMQVKAADWVKIDESDV